MNKEWRPGVSCFALLGFLMAGPAAQAVDSGLGGQVTRQEPLILTYVANEGVLISCGDAKILIDALFDKPNPEYRPPSAEALDKIMTGKAPYDGVDMVLVTHNHPDHFDAPLAVRYIETFPEAILVAPADAAAEMRRAAGDWTKIESRIIPLDIEVGKQEKRNPKQIPVTALRTKHSGDRDSPMNLMYLVELSGWRIFHEGDSNGDVEGYLGFGLGSAAVDLALVHFWFPLDPKCADFLQRTLKPDHIALMHLPIRLESDAPGKIDQVRASYKDMFLMLPGMPARSFQKQAP